MIPYHNLKRFWSKAIKEPGYAFRVFARRLRAYLYYLFGKGKSCDLESITLFLTHRCNLRCKMCGQWGEAGVTKKQGLGHNRAELQLPKLKSIIDEVSAFKPNMTIFGGEPLLFPEWLEVIRYIKSKGMHCLMITNGSLLEEAAGDVVASGLDELNVSLDAGSALHDQIRGMPGLFDRIMGGLKQISYFKNKTKRKKPHVNLQCTITRYNYLCLEQVIDAAGEGGVDSLTFHNLIFVDRGILDRQNKFDDLLGCNSADWEGFIFDAGINPEVLYEKMAGILKGKYRFAVDFYPNFSKKSLIDYYSDNWHGHGGYPGCCLSPWVAAYLFPDGVLRPCLNLSYSYGNVANNKISELCNNERAIRFRQLLKRERAFPVCARCSELYRY